MDCDSIRYWNFVDAVLEKLENVITGDAIILDKCVSWINLNAKILEECRLSVC